jgi:hypothetical protein
MAGESRISDTWNMLSGRENINYIITTLALLGNILFYVSLQLRPLRVIPALLAYLLTIILVFVVPVILGYMNSSFSLGVSIGILPMLLWAIEIASLSRSWRRTILDQIIVKGGIWLPIAAILFGIGVAARERGVRGDRMKNIYKKIFITLVIGGIILGIHYYTNLLITSILQ